MSSRHWADKLDAVGETPVSRVLRSGHPRLVALIMAVAEESRTRKHSVPDLIRFARHSQVRKVRNCIEEGHDLDVQDTYGLSAMHWAAITGCLDLAKLLINRGGQVNPRDGQLTDLTPLTIARLMGYEEVARYLATHGGLE